MINTCLIGDSRTKLKEIPDGSIQCCITSPPYWGLRDYGHDNQIGLEETPKKYIDNIVEVFREVRRVLADDGILWLNLGDSYSSSSNTVNNIKSKDLVGIPWSVAFALREDGWWLRQDIIWSKPNPMPESITDRCTKAHEYLFMMTKSSTYYYDQESIKEDAVHAGLMIKKSDPKTNKRAKKGKYGKTAMGFTKHDTLVGDKRIRRSVWSIAHKTYSGSHFAVMPAKLVEPCVLAGSRVGDTVLDPFFGSGTVGQVAERLGRNWIGVELNPAYLDLQSERTSQIGLGI